MDTLDLGFESPTPPPNLCDRELDIYVAGLFDGEGTVTLVRKNKGKFKAPICSMTSTTKSLLQLLKSSYGGYIRKQKKYKEHHKDAWIWSVVYDPTLDLLSRIYQFIREPEKRRRAYLLLSQYKSITPRNGRYTDEMLDKKNAFELEFFSEPTGH